MFQTSFCLTCITFCQGKETWKRDHSLELNTVFTSENLLVQLGEKDSVWNIQKNDLL